ncbi:MAG: NUDIX hydrolase [Anaerolineaceae bacterium]|nr:NUDIX hydrolase [Anaerolineaceae bacterium]
MSRIARFCPACGHALNLRQRLGALRPVCDACDHVVFFDPRVAVAAWIRQDARLLLVRRLGDPLAGFWAMPAGFMEYDEHPEAALRREVLEETGLQVRVEQLLQLFHTPADGGLANLVLVYEASICGGELLAGDDADAVDWFRRDQLPPLAFLPTQALVRRWQAGAL